MGSGIPIKSKTTENAKSRKSAFVLRGGSCSLKMLGSVKNFVALVKNGWSYVKKKYKLNMPFLRLAYPARASAFSSNAA